jgi:small-conductance mechanosensitive channel
MTCTLRPEQIDTIRAEIDIEREPLAAMQAAYALGAADQAQSHGKPLFQRIASLESENKPQGESIRQLLADNERLQSALFACEDRIEDLEEEDRLMVAHLDNVGRDADHWHSFVSREYEAYFEQATRSPITTWGEYKARRDAQIDSQS